MAVQADRVSSFPSPHSRNDGEGKNGAPGVVDTARQRESVDLERKIETNRAAKKDDHGVRRSSATPGAVQRRR